MSRLTLEQILIFNLAQKISEDNRMAYMTREDAYETLKKYTDEDFGYDTHAWERWFRENKEEDAWKGLRRLQESEDNKESASPLGM